MIVSIGLLMLLSFPSPSIQYSIDCLALDFNCGSLGDTMGDICLTFKSQKRRRSVDNNLLTSLDDEEDEATLQDLSASEPSFHPRATHLSHRNQQHLSKIYKVKEALSSEEAHMMLSTSGRYRRAPVKRQLRDECCNLNHHIPCVFEEVAEYCITLKPGVYNCTSP